MFNIPDARMVLRELSPVLEQVQIALECGTLQAREYFGSLRLRTDTDLAPNIVRFHAKRTLDVAKKTLLEGERSSYSLRKIPNNGLMLRGDAWKLRILKVSTMYDGKLPAPGHTTARQQYWNANRQFLLDLEFPSSFIQSIFLNLIVLWETDSHYNLSKLYLACPKSGGTRFDSARAYWIEEIPCFGIFASGSGINQTTPETDNDLDITLPDFPETGTEDQDDES